MIIDKKELGKKIQKERKKRGLTQEKIEKRIGLPQKALTRIESGERSPSTLELAKLAEVFNIPIGDFFEDKIDEDPFIVLHRVAPGLEQDSKIQEEVHRCFHLCNEGIFLEKLLKKSSRQRVQFTASEEPSNPIEAIKQGEQAAKAERKRLGLGNLPIHDIVKLFTSQGIWCAAIHLPSEMSGLFLFHPSVGMVILVNASNSISRQIFSYAHEYAHALFDVDRKVLISNAQNSSDLIEKRANAFAAAFLMPEEGIAEIIETEKCQFSKTKKISPQDIALIADNFGVSYQAAVYRLYSLRYFNKKSREELFDSESKGKTYLRILGLKNLEKPSKTSFFQRELKTYISRLVIEAYRQEKISRGRVIELCKLLNLPPQEFINTF